MRRSCGPYFSSSSCIVATDRPVNGHWKSPKKTIVTSALRLPHVESLSSPVMGTATSASLGGWAACGGGAAGSAGATGGSTFATTTVAGGALLGVLAQEARTSAAAR